MAVKRYRFVSHHPVLRNQLHSGLPMTDTRWNKLVAGNGSLDGTVVVPDDSQLVTLIRAATEPLQSAIYVKNPANDIIWGGPVIDRTWVPNTNSLKVSVMEWRAWLYFLTLGPDPDNDVFYQFSSVDQLEIARTIALLAVGAGISEGSHPMTATVQLSGKLRDLSFYGTQLKKAGELIDSMANRDGGFEWTLQSNASAVDGLPIANFHCHYPQQGSVLPNLVFKATASGGNCTPSEVQESAASRFSRFWATGSGQPPDQVFAYDNDPDLVNGNTLRLDGGASFSTVSERSTLASHARRSRRFYAPGINLITVQHNLDAIDPDSYDIGDRGRLILRDRFMNIDQENVRIISKEISTSGAGSVNVTLDLTDDTLPEVDAGGMV